MKKLFSFFAVLITALVMTSCGGGNTPTEVAEKSMKCLIDKDYKGYVDLLYMDEEADAEKIQRYKDGAVAMVGEKYDKLVEKEQGIKEYKVISEEVKDSVATVKMNITFGNGKIDESDIKLKKNKDGDWKISNSK